MGLIDKATSGVKIGPQINTIVGTEGVGKSTFASKFPHTIFADIEDGSSHIDTTRLGSSKLPDYQSLVDLVNELTTTEHQYKTLVIDSITTLENYIHLSLTKGSASIEEYGGGYGKGFTRAREILIEFMGMIKKLRDTKGMTINLVGHTQVKSFHDPMDNEMYDRYIIQAHEKFAQIIKSQSDNVFFCKHEISVMEDKKTKKKMAYGDGRRVMRTEWRAGADAKNRLNLPYELPLDYKAFTDAMGASEGLSVDAITKDITDIIKSFDADLQTKVMDNVAKGSTDIQKLLVIKNRALELAQQ